MAERILFLTGHLAENRLRRLLAGLGETDFEWEVVNIGVKVAALMTEPIILRRLPRPVHASRIVLPGRAGVDPARLSADWERRFVTPASRTTRSAPSPTRCPLTARCCCPW